MQLEKALLYRAKRLDDLYVFQANYKRFRFSRHAHEDFALGLMYRGTQQFDCRGRAYQAPPGSVITMNAGEVHDGMSADGEVYRYRMIYIPADLMRDISSAKLPAGEHHCFNEPVTVDAELAGWLDALFYCLDDERSDGLEVQCLFYDIVTAFLRRHGSDRLPSDRHKTLPDSIARACAYIGDMAGEDISLGDIAQAAGLSRYHFLRLFRTSLGVTPHAYLLQRRLELAKSLLRAGASLADAALDARFADQSHFTRRFKAACGITPRQYQRAVR